MQLKTLLPSILLLAIPETVFAAPDDAVPVRYVRASSLGVSKRNPFALNMQPLYKAMELNATPLVKRQSCPIGSSACFSGCCNLGTVCGIYGGEEGCCPVGKRCGGVSGCQNAEDVDCSTYCCPSGTVCTTDSSGEGTCGRQDDNTGNGLCETGFSACTIFEGCCPNGSECVLPKNCNIPCASDDPVCGNGCCQKGYVCTADLTCAKDTSNDFTSLVPSTTRTRTTVTKEVTTELPTETSSEESSTETTESSSSTDIFPNGSDSTTTTTTEDSTTTTTTRRTIVTTQTLNAAPTMGAMLGGGLGMAAGIIGVLAM